MCTLYKNKNIRNYFRHILSQYLKKNIKANMLIQLISLFLDSKKQRSTLVFAVGLTCHSYYSKLAFESSCTNCEDSSLDFYVHNVFWYALRHYAFIILFFKYFITILCKLISILSVNFILSALDRIQILKYFTVWMRYYSRRGQKNAIYCFINIICVLKLLTVSLSVIILFTLHIFSIN